MNRIASSSFPNTISDVIYQSGQFTPAYSGSLASALASGAGSGYYDAAYEALAGSDPTGGALYFNTSHGSGVQIGAHWFY
jgi:spore germination cell wall hydrolase CwlJ-like protein